MANRPRVRVVVPVRRVELEFPFPIEVTPSAPPPPPTRSPRKPDWDEPDNPIVSYLRVPDIPALRELEPDTLEQWIQARPPGHPIAIEVRAGAALRIRDLGTVIEVAERRDISVVIRFPPDA